MIDFLLFLKPVFDALWEYKIFNLLLIFWVFVLFLINLPKIKLTLTNTLLLLIFFLLIRSFLININLDSTAVFIKITSAFMLLYLAQFNKNPNRTLKIIAISFIPTILITIFMALSGYGYIFWGDVNTFVGPFFYKADLAISITLSAIFLRYFLYFTNSSFIKFIVFSYLFFVAPFLIYLSNSRMLMVVYLIVFAFLIFEYIVLEQVKISNGIKSILIVLFLVASIFSFNWYNAWASAEGLLSISLNSETFFSAENTQGRNGIWDSIFTHFSEGTLDQILLGFWVNADYQLNSHMENDAHNTFIKVLVSTGVVGFLLYLIFLARVLMASFRFNRATKNNRHSTFLSHTIILILIFYLVSGLTQSNIIYTQTSWYVFYFIGMLFHPSIKEFHKTSDHLNNKINLR